MGLFGKMSFFLGLVLGIACGVGLVIAFVRSENSRSKLRCELVRKNHDLGFVLIFFFFFY